MKRSVALCALLVLIEQPSTASRDDPVPCRGHITLAGPWTTVRSMSVLNDRDDVDGFFCGGLPPAGTELEARVVRNGSGLPYSLALNFHSDQTCGPGRARCWKGGCPPRIGGSITSTGDARCSVPDTIPAPTTVEVTGLYGADLDIDVVIVPPEV